MLGATFRCDGEAFGALEGYYGLCGGGVGDEDECEAVSLDCVGYRVPVSVAPITVGLTNPKLHIPDQHHSPVDENITRVKRWTHPGVVPTSPFRSTSSASKDRSKVNRIALIVAKAKRTPLKESESLCQPNSRHFRSAPCQHARGPIPKVVTFP